MALAVPPMIKPWGSDIFPLPNPISMMNQIGGSLYEKDTDHHYNEDCQNKNFVPNLFMNPMLQPAVTDNNKHCMENVGEGLNVKCFTVIGY